MAEIDLSPPKAADTHGRMMWDTSDHQLNVRCKDGWHKVHPHQCGDGRWSCSIGPAYGIGETEAEAVGDALKDLMWNHAD